MTSSGQRGAKRSAYGGRSGLIGERNLIVERFADVVGSSHVFAVGSWSSKRYLLYITFIRLKISKNVPALCYLPVMKTILVLLKVLLSFLID